MAAKTVNSVVFGEEEKVTEDGSSLQTEVVGLHTHCN
jgi:hypothetical protein